MLAGYRPDVESKLGEALVDNNELFSELSQDPAVRKALRQLQDAVVAHCRPRVHSAVQSIMQSDPTPAQLAARVRAGAPAEYLAGIGAAQVAAAVTASTDTMVERIVGTCLAPELREGIRQELRSLSSEIEAQWSWATGVPGVRSLRALTLRWLARHPSQVVQQQLALPGGVTSEVQELCRWRYTAMATCAGCLVDAQTGAALGSVAFSGLRSRFTPLCVTTSGRYLVRRTGEMADTLGVYPIRLDTGHLQPFLHHLHGHHDWIADMVAIGGDLIATCGHDGAVLVWDVSMPDAPPLCSYLGHSQTVWDIALLPGRLDPSMRLRSTANVTYVTGAATAVTGPTAASEAARAAADSAADDVADAESLTLAQLVSCGNEGIVTVWEVSEPGRPVACFLRNQSPANCCCIVPGTRYIAVGYHDGAIIIWDPDTGPMRPADSILSLPSGWVYEEGVGDEETCSTCSSGSGSGSGSGSSDESDGASDGASSSSDHHHRRHRHRRHHHHRRRHPHDGGGRGGGRNGGDDGDDSSGGSSDNGSGSSSGSDSDSGSSGSDYSSSDDDQRRNIHLNRPRMLGAASHLRRIVRPANLSGMVMGGTVMRCLEAGTDNPVHRLCVGPDQSIVALCGDYIFGWTFDAVTPRLIAESPAQSVGNFVPLSDNLVGLPDVLAWRVIDLATLSVVCETESVGSAGVLTRVPFIPGEALGSDGDESNSASSTAPSSSSSASSSR